MSLDRGFNLSRGDNTRSLLGMVVLAMAFLGNRSLGEPSLQIHRELMEIIVTFSGELHASDQATGPWAPVGGAVSPLRIASPQSPRYFRALDRGSNSSSVFGPRSIVSWTLIGPLQTHFQLAFAGVPDGIFPPRREKPYFDATLLTESLSLPVRVRVRGNSSLQECPFPKLKFKVSRDTREGTPFADAREIKIGTHCADGGHGPIGRLRDERATFREALAYETMELLGFVGSRVRRAQFQFRDTSPTNEFGTTQWVVQRNALLIEDVEVVGERLGGRALSDQEIVQLKDVDFGVQLISDLRFLHTLLGNWDYALSVDGRGLWNTEVIELANGTKLPIAGDFDLCSWVTETVRLSAPRDFHPELLDLDREALFQLEQIRGGVGFEVFENSRGRFVTARPQIEALIRTATLDDLGRSNALAHVTSFFAALGSVR